MFKIENNGGQQRDKSHNMKSRLNNNTTQAKLNVPKPKAHVAKMEAALSKST